MKAIVNEGCIGCGMCAAICPEVFRLNEEELSEVYAPADDYAQQVEEAAASCPVAVIEIEK